MAAISKFMNRHIFTSNDPRKRWIGDGYAAVSAAKLRANPNVLNEMKKGFENIGEQMGAIMDMCEIEVIQDALSPHILTFKANYYTFK